MAFANLELGSLFNGSGDIGSLFGQGLNDSAENNVADSQHDEGESGDVFEDLLGGF